MDDITQARWEALAQFQAGFLANASHELRAPMTQIISLHQLILEGLCEDPAEERQFLRQSFETTQKVLANLDLLISISKLTIGRIQPKLQEVYLQDVFVQLQMLVQMIAENRSCRLRFEAGEADRVKSDSDWLVEALRLLVEGAIAAQSEQLHIHSRFVDQQQHISVTTDSDPGLWAKDLEDLPIPAADTPAAGFVQNFSPGYCQQLAARILQPLGGSLVVNPDNSPDNQQTFLITLPAFQP
ncbi:hypothetical protein C7271_06375 [filamentous cyanobacterium CCP5]|nr:hypothetical protein C7271_06375 [filamentous cyanobacterium CCP5]